MSFINIKYTVSQKTSSTCLGPGLWGAKISGDPVQSVCSQAFWRCHYLRAFPGGVDTGAPGIKSDWCIYGIRAVYGFLAV